MKRLILASASPRRYELLSLTLLPFETYPSTLEEKMDHSLTPSRLVESLAEQKAADIFTQKPECVILGADTIVSYQNNRLGKPKNRIEAAEMLRMLSGQTHEVYTGVCLIDQTKKVIFSVKTSVTFYTLDENTIDWYLNTGEPFDKAGSYGIQGSGSLLVEKIEGDYFNVVGLPISKVVRSLKDFGFSFTESVTKTE
ncbi:septum formation inhibitor Maf [Fictibacillus sp. 5RED26]|uniref:Maf family protein n=1 Tax=Fictibacillus TaxID=1329200 RepID=UPI0018CD79B0|nr:MULTISPECIES: Maf family protein [unclassified Fictibacillus]MBH0157717.1 septum formation inhibitor Maf [Fictibacillus sp. 5RED26]MBH0163319.1 septum formation inhibitor Maf [Fictibacillus sp. 7GRE50]MBH0175113.1 septum formation inhibitor Maf [Fictibacillus sp. 23RED33]